MPYGSLVCLPLVPLVCPPPSPPPFAKGIANSVRPCPVGQIDEALLRMTVPMFTLNPRNQGVRTPATGGCQ